jgi:DNA modification methylase
MSPIRPYYEQDGIVIYNADCRALLPLLKADLILTDPPYGIGEARANNASRSSLAKSKDYGVAQWDDCPPAEWLFLVMREISRYQIIFGGNYFPLPPSKCWLVWDKVNGDNDFADCELAWTNLPKAVRKIEWRWHGMLQQDMSDKEIRVHPTQKPEGVMKWAIKQAPEDVATILDPFMGSGTSLVAAKSFGLKATGIEINEAYCEAAVQRLAQEVLF